MSSVTLTGLCLRVRVSGGDDNGLDLDALFDQADEDMDNFDNEPVDGMVRSFAFPSAAQRESGESCSSFFYVVQPGILPSWARAGPQVCVSRESTQSCVVSNCFILLAGSARGRGCWVPRA